MGSKMTIVVLRKQTSFNQDFKFRCFLGKYQVFLFHQDSVNFSNRTNSKQEKIRIPCRPSDMPAECLHYLLAVPAEGLNFWGCILYVVICNTRSFNGTCLPLFLP